MESKEEKKPIAPPYCDPEFNFDPTFKGDTGSQQEKPAEEVSATGLNPFPGWARPDDEFVVDL